MKRIFTMGLGLLLASSMNVMSKDINVTVDDNFIEILNEAEAGDVLILADGEYSLPENTSTVEIAKNITIKAANEGKAILNQFQFVAPADVTVKNITIDGVAAKHDPTADSKYFFQVNTATSSVGNLTIKNCTVHGYGRGIVRATTDGAILDNLVIDNCVFTENSNASAGYTQLNIQKVKTKSATIKNTTFYKSKAALLRYEGAEEIKVLFENCTVLNCNSSGGRNTLEVGSSVPTTSTFKFKNCIISGSYDAVAPEKPIDSRNLGDIESSLLEGFSSLLLKRTTETTPVEGTVTSFSFESFEMKTSPETISGIGDARWSLNGGSLSIEAADVDKNIEKVEYFNLFGNKVSADVEGVLVKKTTYDDGSVSTSKVFNK
ncbi:DUF4957 domain-containing protein [Dysgonomonas sp. 520]|uniref:DUF4957 domain-containing protein n=1 Tax=Dysgonomonas sp. 520 TaxID=2302931 RepID=UPI0013D2E589|nr:DUF4957 domain-containing protein [Dysgonomonas sp. 520]NDW08703.1 DUF4957 domain-containing protein [Dysgonomonas sp. 520]